jgi:hypothetical protein
MNNLDSIIPNWTFYITETSFGVYLVTGRASYGSEVSYHDSDLNYALQKCENYAFDIEKQLSKNLSKFIYNYFLIKLNKLSILANNISYENWAIELKSARIIYNNRDTVISLQNYEEGNWLGLLSRNIASFEFQDIINYCKLMEFFYNFETKRNAEENKADNVENDPLKNDSLPFIKVNNPFNSLVHYIVKKK